MQKLTVQPWLDGYFMQQKKLRDAASNNRPATAGRLAFATTNKSMCKEEEKVMLGQRITIAQIAQTYTSKEKTLSIRKPLCTKKAPRIYSRSLIYCFIRQLITCSA